MRYINGDLKKKKKLSLPVRYECVNICVKVGQCYQHLG